MASASTAPIHVAASPRIRLPIAYKPAMAKALGFGYAIPLKMTAPEGEWGYDPTS